jgi:hypothetical protein
MQVKRARGLGHRTLAHSRANNWLFPYGCGIDNESAIVTRAIEDFFDTIDPDSTSALHPRPVIANSWNTLRADSCR